MYSLILSVNVHAGNVDRDVIGVLDYLYAGGGGGREDRLKLNKIGDVTAPWGTPALQFLAVEVAPLKLTLHWRPWR